MKIPNIWVTIGQRGFNEDNFIDLVQDNITGIRINTGRSSYPWIYSTVKYFQKLGYPTENILLDIGNTKPRLFLADKKGITLQKGNMFVISYQNTTGVDAWLPNNHFFKEVQKGDVIYFGDGEIEGIVHDIQDNKVMVLSTTNGMISESVSIGIKGKNFFHFYISEDEINEVNKLLDCYPMQIILSFVENEDNIKWAQQKFQKAVSIIPKIETFSAVENIEEILGLSDCIFIGRGDLGLSVGIEQMGIIQDILLKKAHRSGCKISLGTGTLDSLKWSEIPLRAEIIDITNSCMKEVDTIVLTSETGGSKSPFKAINYLKKCLEYIKTVEL